MAVEIAPHFYQAQLMLSTAPNIVGVWGRRAGKSTGARFKVVHTATTKPGSVTWVVALTFGQAKSLYWDALVGDGNPDRLIPEELIASKSISELWFKLKNGSRVYLKGSDRIDSQLGASLDLLVLDEFQSQSIHVWNKLKPMLVDRASSGSQALIIGTPRGYNHLYDLYWKGAPENPNKEPNWMSLRITSIDAANEGTGLRVEDIEDAKNDMSSDQYAQEFLASFDAVSGRVFKPFDVKLNVTELPFIERADEFDSLPMRVGMDFNVDPMTACIAVKPDRMTLYVYDEIYINNSNTPEVIEKLKMLREKRGNRQVIVYPDASGSQRTSTGQSTNHSLLENAGFRLMVDRANPAVHDRINEVNALLCNANDLRRLFIHPRCKQLIKTLNALTYNEHGDPDKKSGYDHMADALGYLVHQEFPIGGSNRPSTAHI